MKSMTGYGRGAAAADGVEVSVDVTGVNRKQLDVAVSLPRELTVFEADVRTMVGARVARGRITVNVALRMAGVRSRPRIDLEAAALWHREMVRLQEHLGLSGEISVESVLRAPGVMATVEPAPADATLRRLLKAALQTAMDALDAMRKREGRHLASELKRRVAALEKAVKTAGRLQPEAVVRHREALLGRIRQAGVNVGEGDDRLLKEVALFAERSDISEEVARVSSHLEQLGALLKSDEPAGRPLEFLAQELAREFNTLGAKSQHASLSRAVLEARGEVEKIREQVQNVE